MANIVITGDGFLGSRIVENLRKRGQHEILVVTSAKCDLTDFRQSVSFFEKLKEEWKPEILIHTAALYGGIMFNELYPVTVFTYNQLITASIVEAVRVGGFKKVISIGSACAYPGFLTGYLSEEDFWAGPCHDSVASYGIIKRSLEVGLSACQKENPELEVVHTILTNLYGEGDSYRTDRSHVVAALIRRFSEAVLFSKSKVEVWGTGKAVRDFLYVGDAADAVVSLMEMSLPACGKPFRINVGSGIPVSIKELVEIIAEESGFKGEIAWDSSKPDGQLFKVLDIRRITELGWAPKVSLRDGLRRTIAWFQQNRDAAILK